MRLLATVWLLNMVVLGGLLYYVYVGPVFSVDHLAGQRNVAIINSSPPQFGVLVTLGGVLGLGLVIIVGLHMSHQIAGPLAQTKSKLRQIARGELSARLQFREGDYLADLPDYFNEVVDSLREREQHEIETLRTIEASLDEASPARGRLRELLEEKQARFTETATSSLHDELAGSNDSDPMPALDS